MYFSSVVTFPGLLITMVTWRATFSERGPYETSGAARGPEYKRKPQTEDVIRCIYYNTFIAKQAYQ